ncbi:MAG: transglycosylase SLT domain-containing protein [bacterium]
MTKLKPPRQKENWLMTILLNAFEKCFCFLVAMASGVFVFYILACLYQEEKLPGSKIVSACINKQALNSVPELPVKEDVVDQFETLIRQCDPNSNLVRTYIDILSKHCHLDKMELLVIARQCRELEMKYGFQPFLLLAIAECESSFNQKAISSAGAIGLNQVMPSTAKWMVELGLPIDLGKDPMVVLQCSVANLTVSSCILNYYLSKHPNLHVALAYYSGFAKDYASKVLRQQKFFEDAYIEKYLQKNKKVASRT